MLSRWADQIGEASLAKGVLIILVILIAFAFGPLFTILRWGLRELAILVLVLGAVIIALVPNIRVLRWGLVLWIVTFGFGWRSLYLTPNLTIHPSEVLAVLLFFMLVVHVFVHRQRLDFSIPPYIPLLVAWGAVGVIVGWVRGNPIDVILSEYKIFLVAIPAYYVVKHLITNRQDWERAVYLCILVAVYISSLGLIEVLAPDLSRTLTGNSAGTFQAVTGFERAGFVFYGASAAGFAILPFFGLTVHKFLTQSKNRLELLVWGGAVVVEAIGIYIAGYRGLWYSTVALLIVYALVSKRLWVLVFGILAIPFLPSEFSQRFLSLYDLQYSDSSQFKRIDRATAAFDLLKENPLTGVGWGGSGYVHSDLIQIGANLGILGLGLFLLWLAHLLWRMFQLARQPGWIGGYAMALFATVCGLTVAFAGEGSIVWAQLMLPIWFLFAMGYKLDELAQTTATSV